MYIRLLIYIDMMKCDKMCDSTSFYKRELIMFLLFWPVCVNCMLSFPQGGVCPLPVQLAHHLNTLVPK